MTVKQWQRRPSTFARQALGVYAALVVYGSLYPFSGWRSLGLGPFAYLTDPLPQYLTAFDVVTNVLGYMPFGALVVLALYPRWRGALAVGAAFLGGALLSGAMEAIQTYLPTRVASNLDLAANALGALLGAVLTAPATSMLLDRGLLRRIRFIWFERDAAYVLGLSALWPFATMFPAPFLFALGDLPRVLWDGARSVDAGRDPRLGARRVGYRKLAGRFRQPAARRRVGSADHVVQPVRGARARDVAHAPARPAHAADARTARRDARRKGGRIVPAIARGPDVRLGDRRRAGRHRDRRSGRDAHACSAARAARGARGRDARSSRSCS